MYALQSSQQSIEKHPLPSYAESLESHGMITNTIDNGFCAELSQLITRKLFTFIATSNIMTYGTVKKAVVSTVFTAITNIVRKATVTNIGKGRTRPTKQTAYRCTFFVRYSVHK